MKIKLKWEVFSQPNGAGPAIWVSTPVLTTGDATNFPGGTGHFEPLVAPIITYTINTNFTTSPATPCAGQVVNFTNTTTPTGVLTNRMYNFNRFLNHFFLEPDSTYAWDADPVNPANQSSGLKMPPIPILLPADTIQHFLR